MPLEVYTAADVRAGILSRLVLAIEATNSGGRLNVDFCAGLAAMAKSEALAYHVKWGDLVQDARQALGDDLADLLDAAIRCTAIEG